MSKPSSSGNGNGRGPKAAQMDPVLDGEDGISGIDGGEAIPQWLPPGLRNGLPEHLGGGLPPGWGGAVPGLLNTRANRPSTDEDDGTGEIPDDGGTTALPRFDLLDDGTLFDRDYYLTQNPDVAAAAADPAQHYLLFGRDEGRTAYDLENPPSPGDAGIVELEDGSLFDPAYYLAQNPDVAAANLDPREHYLLFGRDEGRAASSIDTPVEGTEADDLLIGDVADNLMSGGAGADALDGGAGTDLLNGGAGDDLLTGGEGTDVFVFDAASGNDTVTDFTAGTDILMISSSYGFADAQAVLAAASETVDGDVVLALADGESVTLQGVALADLTDTSFALF